MPALRRLRFAIPVLAVLVLLGVAFSRVGANASAGAAPSTPAGHAVLVHAAASGRVISTAAGVSTIELPSHRAYLLARPVTTGRIALPLVVLLHGTDISAASMMRFTGFEAMAETDRFLLAAPESDGPTWNSGDGCCGAPARTHLNDTAYVESVVADVRARADVDPSRIYLVGYSAGGKLSYDVACAMPTTFAATATYGAGPQLRCSRAVAHAVLVGYGDEDTTEPIAGKPHNDRGQHQPAAETVQQMRSLDRCAARATVRVVGPATIDAWTSCGSGTAVEYVRWADQTHHFPAAPTVPAAATAATLMWQFFGQHVRAGTFDGAAPVHAKTTHAATLTTGQARA